MLLLLLTTLQAYAGAEPKSSCVIPVQVKTYDVDPELYPEYGAGVYDAVMEWNSKHTGYYYQIVNWNSTTEVNDYNVTISMGALPNGMLGQASSRTGQNSMIDRLKIVLSSSEHFCKSKEQKECYSVKDALLHELGHAVGMQHAKVETSVMWYGIKFSDESTHSLTETDVESARALYAAKGCSTAHGGLEWGAALPSQ